VEEKRYSEKTNAKSGSQNKRGEREKVSRRPIGQDPDDQCRWPRRHLVVRAKKNTDYARNIEIEGEPNHDVKQNESDMKSSDTKRKF